MRLACLPDLDGDGVPESIVAVIYPEKMDMEGGGNALPDTWEMTFLVTGKGPDWRGVAPLAISGSEVGVEGTVSGERRAGEARGRKMGAGGANGGGTRAAIKTQDSEEVHRYALKSGKLVPLGRPTRRRMGALSSRSAEGRSSLSPCPTPPATPRPPPATPVSNWIVTRWGRRILNNLPVHSAAPFTCCGRFSTP